MPTTVLADPDGIIRYVRGASRRAMSTAK